MASCHLRAFCHLHMEEGFRLVGPYQSCPLKWCTAYKVSQENTHIQVTLKTAAVALVSSKVL